MRRPPRGNRGEERREKRGRVRFEDEQAGGAVESGADAVGGEQGQLARNVATTTAEGRGCLAPVDASSDGTKLERGKHPSNA